MRFYYLICWAALWYLLPLVDATPVTSPEHSTLHARVNVKAGSSKSAGKQVATHGRNAYMFFEIKQGFERTWGTKPGWPTHSILWIDGDEDNGAVKLDITFADGNKNHLDLNYVEYLKEKDVEAPEAQETYGLKEPIGATGVSNTYLIDQNAKGTPGILMDAIRQDPIYRTGRAHRHNLNSCHDVLARIVALTDGLTMSQRSRVWIQTYNTWVIEQAGEKYNIRSPIRYISKYAGWTESTKHQARHIKSFGTDVCVERRLKRDVACSLPTDESANAESDVLELAAPSRHPKLLDALRTVSTDDSAAKPAPPGMVKDSRKSSYLSGWHFKFVFHIG